ncbi:VanZ family protein [Streptomyces sp. NBC_01727]|uniref:VanZ family protein n=1 Tax=Streptomyces sp. NBC_01727 TaxID=2975924 RepID=UPI002E1061AF|nr:VanZ family protein [Streptomyces sp. NBC_01727]
MIRREVLLDGLLASSVLPFLYVTLSQGYGDGTVVSLMPFGELSSSFGSSQIAFSDVTLLNVGGNAALLFVFGALVPLRSAHVAALGRVAAVAALLSASVEYTQYVLALGRVVSVDDVLVNTAGAVAGALMSRRWRRRRDADGSAGAENRASLVS